MLKYTEFKAGKIVNTVDYNKLTKLLDDNQRERERGERRRRRKGQGSHPWASRCYIQLSMYTYIYTRVRANIEHF